LKAAQLRSGLDADLLDQHRPRLAASPHSPSARWSVETLRPSWSASIAQHGALLPSAERDQPAVVARFDRP
jgi:hypothetical protein